MNKIQKMAALAKLVAGDVGPEALASLFEAIGWEAQFRPLEPGQYPIAFQGAAKTALRPGAQVLAIRGRDGEGNAVEALLVLAPAPALEANRGTKIMLDKPQQAVIT